MGLSSSHHKCSRLNPSTKSELSSEDSDHLTLAMVSWSSRSQKRDANKVLSGCPSSYPQSIRVAIEPAINHQAPQYYDIGNTEAQKRNLSGRSIEWRAVSTSCKLDRRVMCSQLNRCSFSSCFSFGFLLCHALLFGYPVSQLQYDERYRRLF